MHKSVTRRSAFRIVLACALGAPGLPAFAQLIEIGNAWVRGTVAAQNATGAYMEITSKSPATLIGVTSPAAAAVEIHEMRMDGTTMTMRALDKLELPAGKTVKLLPGGYHLMLVGLKHSLPPGGAVPLALEIQTKDGKRSKIEVKAEVQEIGAVGRP